MLDHILNFFNIVPDYDLKVMRENQSLAYLSATIINNLSEVIVNEKPDIIFVQGDTTTACLGALVGFYNKIPVAHIEAGLRSFNKYSPFPEEMNRLLISKIATIHFCPTQLAVNNLVNENISTNIHNVGNTVIDALLLGLEQVNHSDEMDFYNYFDMLKFDQKIVLITAHRRESFGQPFEQICLAIRKAAENFSDVQFVYPVHLNPSVQKPVHRILSNCKNVYLIDPLDYKYFIWLLNKSYLVLTDSGGIQEEAPSLDKPVLVMRDVTERMEGVEAGNAILVGTDANKIYYGVKTLLTKTNVYKQMTLPDNPYGDGKSCINIKRIVSEFLNE